MLNCKDVRPLLAEYEAGSLPEAQAAQVADHLLLCPICAAALEDLRREKERPAAPILSPAAPRSLGTQDPLAGQTPAPAADAAAPEADAVPEAQPDDKPAPRRKLRRRTKVLIVLAVLVVLVGTCAGVLWKMEAFSIRDWAKSADGSFVAVIYAGTEDGKDGFRLRLWDKEEKAWSGQWEFLDAAYQQMQWSPDGNFLAIESCPTDAETHKINLLRLEEESPVMTDIAARIKSEMDGAFGCLGKTPLAAVPSCKILGWTDDSNALLMWAQGAEEPVDPDYGIEFADSSGVSGAVSGGITYDVDPDASGILMYDVDTYALDVVQGFGTVSLSQQERRNNQLQNRFYNYMSSPGLSFMQMERETVFGEEALLKLHQVAADGGILTIGYDLSSTSTVGFMFVDADLSVLAELESAEGIMLVLCREKFRQDPVKEAFLILPYNGVAQ